MSEIKLPELPEPAQPENAGSCCGNFTTGGEYMGQSEQLCCGQPDEAWPDYYSADQMQEYARQAVREAVPEGYVVVPATPTNAMRDAGNTHVLSRSALFAAWNAMIAAAKEQP